MAAGAENNKASTSPYPGFLPGNQLGFRKGVSGNPGGRSKILREVERLALSYSKEAVERLHHLAHHGRSERIQVAACIALLDRALGRPAVRIVDKDGEDRPIVGRIENVIVSSDGRCAPVEARPSRDPGPPIDREAEDVLTIDEVAVGGDARHPEASILERLGAIEQRL